MTKGKSPLDTAASDLVSMMMGVDKMIKITNPDISNRDNVKYWALSILERDGPQSMSSLGLQTHISKPYMTRVVDSLINDGYVERRSDPHDRRVIIISITKEGEKINKKFLISLRDSVKPFLKTLTQEELDNISSASNDIVEIFSKCLTQNQILPTKKD